MVGSVGVTAQPFSPQRTWANDYLQNLRTNKPSRPTGARPLPSKNETLRIRNDGYSSERAASAMDIRGRESINGQNIPERAASAMSLHRDPIAANPRLSIGSPLAQPPTRNSRDMSGLTAGRSSIDQGLISKISTTQAGLSQPYKIPYYERGQRWMEKQEMSSLRQALEKKDVIEEQKIFTSAQDEAADLVWKHQNPGLPYPNPDRPNLRDHLKQGSHARTLSNGPYESLYVKKGVSDGHRTASDGSDQTQASTSDDSQASNSSRNRRFSGLSFSMRSSRVLNSIRSRKSRTSSMDRGQSSFPNPHDQIYEEPADVVHTTQDLDQPKPLRVKARNTSYGTNTLTDQITRIEEKSENSTPVKNVSAIEIYKNAPSQSRNAHYKMNHGAVADKLSSLSADMQNENRSMKEIRGEDIRAATSQKLRDRSPKLPMPTMVTDRPGRPIVSFQKDYSPRQKQLQHEVSVSDPLTNDRSNGPGIPVINFPDEPVLELTNPASIPTISLPDEEQAGHKSPVIPSFSFTSEDSNAAPTINSSPRGVTKAATNSRPLPQPSRQSLPTSRPLPLQGGQLSSKSTPHWTPVSSRGTAQCAACALPIAGKIVSAASKRFHPHCFSCFCCGELLECVAFYPEPEKFRFERLARIQARLNGGSIPLDQAHFSEEDDGDDGLRFYCHLDFHEKFSPRCKSCKTPIEGQVIVACGAEWHVGHFFCAECGDPFSSDMPFVEKDGFAWCVNCHTNRFSGKCAGCRKPITDLVVRALEREWHEQCFRCIECGGEFSDGRFFTRGEEALPVCVRCEEQRLKA